MAKPYKRKDYLYSEAKQAGIRSRAFYKLQELDKKHKLIKHGSNIIDLGAWPGSWIEYCLTRIGSEGKIFGIDLQEIDSFKADNVILYQGDITDESSVDRARECLEGRVDALISDLSPKLTGIKDSDQMAMCALLDSVLRWAEDLLSAQGVFVAKAFKGSDTDIWVRNLKSKFRKVIREELKTTRNSSQEFYIVAWGFIRE